MLISHPLWLVETISYYITGHWAILFCCILIYCCVLCLFQLYHLYRLLIIISQEIGSLLVHAAEAIEEISKSAPTTDVVQGKTKDFLKSLEVWIQNIPYIPW